MRSKISAVTSVFSIGAALLLGSVAVSSPAGATPTPRVASQLSGWVSSLNPTGGGGFNASLSSFTSSGTSIVPVDASGALGTPTVITPVCSGLVQPYGVVSFGTDANNFAFFTTNGDLWVTLNGRQHYLENLPGNYVVSGMAVDHPDAAGAHTIYVSLYSTLDNSGALEVVSYDASGALVEHTTITDPSLGALAVPTWTSSGILAPGQTSGALYRIDPTLASGKVTTLLPAGSLKSPRAATVDEQGTIYVIENGNDSLTQVNPDGSIRSLLTFGTPSDAAGAPSRGAQPPRGQFGTALAFDASTRSLLLARLDQEPPLARRRCAIPANPTTTILRVGTAPQSPTNPQATVVGTTANVSWSPSVDQVIGDLYTVTASPGGGSCSAVAPSTSCAIGGLSPQTSYSFTVLAQSAEGIGAATATVSASTAPTGPTLAATGSSTGLLGMIGLLICGGGLALTNLRRRLGAHR